MHLLFCVGCNDVFRITVNMRKCLCGYSAGVMDKYKEKTMVYGTGILLEIEDESLVKAINNQKENKSKRFKTTVVKKERSDVEYIPITKR